MTMRKVYIRTFGCQMNVRDSEVICGLLRTMNYELTTNPDNADVVIFNTCSVRQHAEDKVWSEIGRYKKGQSLKNNPASDLSGTVPIIGLIGCMAQNYKEKIFERAPQVDFIVGPSDIHKIPDIIENLISSKLQAPNSKLFERKIYETDGGVRPEEIYHTGFYEDKEHAFVVISEGCSNFCSYCVVPYVRGQLKNRKCKDILNEIEEAVEKGITKITLLGQNVNAYNYESINFAKLVRLVELVKGLKEFSFVTSHPKDSSVDLFKIMQDSAKLKKILHLPVQSGSDRILKLMNRQYSRKFYLDLVDKYRKIVKDSVLTTDIIVGFPTENEEDFQDTYDLVNKIKFNSAYIFKYSPRPNTGALKFSDDVSKAEKERRHKVILELQKKISKGKSE